ncbi:hypothetical protein [Methylobacterium brachiatum]|uniref:hypothetical protein n=1 Tax=Methylobacterium brachiatum TaxID=269660 RepID=UPI0024468D03|nr:hypothetical protein [Methylobacterium brachiatum]MDH2313361.1 hypothetical protein [Methylobacterium brachiatum]
MTGAIAFYFTDAPNRIAVEDMPVVAGEVDPHALARLVRQYGPSFAVVERVNAMPSTGKGEKRRPMGAQSMFNFGAACAVARTVIAMCDVPFTMVAPADWKRHHRVPGKPEGGDEAGRLLALRRFPASADRFARKKDHNRADAALIALHAAETLL